MAHYYGILAILGWIWALIVFVYLFVRLRRDKLTQPGFEVVDRNEKHL